MSFLIDRIFFVTISGVRRSVRSFQGSVLSPKLFSIFTPDFPELDEVHLALFAVDSALFTIHSKVNVIIDRLFTALNCLG
jgi:hypothetical protein